MPPPHLMMTRTLLPRTMSLTVRHGHANLPVQGPLWDTMLASQLLNAGLHSRRHRLEDIAKYFLHEELSKEEQSSDWSGELTPEQLQYAATDAAVLLPLRDVLLAELER